MSALAAVDLAIVVCDPSAARSSNLRLLFKALEDFALVSEELGRQLLVLRDCFAAPPRSGNWTECYSSVGNPHQQLR